MAWRIIAFHSGKSGKTVLKTHYESSNKEFRVRVYDKESGKPNKDADYFTNDRTDALGTMKHMVENN